MVIQTLMEGLPEKYRFILVSPDRRGVLNRDPLAERIDAHIHCLPGKGAPHTEFYRMRNDILNQLIETAPDLVHFHSGGVFSWGNRWPFASWPVYLSKHNIPSVWTNHLVVGLLHGYCGNLKPWWFKIGMLPWSYLGKSQQLQSTAAEICVSDHDAAKIRRWYFPFRSKITRIYHSRLEENKIVTAPIPREKTVLAVGHLAFRKGQHILVQAFARLVDSFPAWRLVLVGPAVEGECGAWIRSFCQKKKLEDRVLIVGQQKNTQDWMQRCSVFVQPSLEEALGLALQEAMACGCACIGSRVGGIPELIVNQKNGVLVPPGDVAALTASLKNLLLKPKVRQIYGKHAKDYIAKIGMNRNEMIQEHERIYSKVIRSKDDKTNI
jgi:glycosyltransferase involved in cell wall biosynthesis